MEKLVKLFCGLFLASSLLISCDKDEDDDVSQKNYLKIGETEYVLSKGYEVLYLVDEIDEFALQVMHAYDGKHFKSISQGDLDLMDDAQKEAIEEKKEASKDLLEQLKESLKDKVSDVRLSTRLVSYPVVLVSDEGLSLEMEKILSQMPDMNASDMMKANRILEINSDHPLFEALQKVYEETSGDLTSYAALLYDQACLIEGLPLEDPVQFSQNMSDLMIKASQ